MPRASRRGAGRRGENRSPVVKDSEGRTGLPARPWQFDSESAMILIDTSTCELLWGRVDAAPGRFSVPR
jgi:hypothetical protein